MHQDDQELRAFVTALDTFRDGVSMGHFNGRRYSVNVQRPVNARVTKLFAEESGGSDYVSFNLFRTKAGRTILKPCEMEFDKVLEFVLHFEPDQQHTAKLESPVKSRDLV